MDRFSFVLRAASRILFNLASIPLALIGAPIVCAFARWDRTPTQFTGGAVQGPLAVRGDLPRWARWWETPDERLPGGLYERTVERVWRRYGRYVCSVYWLGVRNRMYGLSFALFGRQVDRAPEGYQRTIKYYGPIMIDYGNFYYRATPEAHWQSGPFIEVWDFKIKSNRAWWRERS